MTMPPTSEPEGIELGRFRHGAVIADRWDVADLKLPNRQALPCLGL